MIELLKFSRALWSGSLCCGTKIPETVLNLYLVIHLISGLWHSLMSTSSSHYKHVLSKHSSCSYNVPGIVLGTKVRVTKSLP
jgi:hypothetical protein